MGIIVACALDFVEVKLGSSRLSNPANSALVEFKFVINSC